MADQAKLDGDEQFKLGNHEEAIRLYTTAIEQNAINGTNAKHILLSNRCASYLSLKKWDKALEDAKATIMANPDFPKGWSRKGAALYGLGDLAGAAQAYKKSLEKEPNSAASKAELNRIEAMLATGNSNASARSTASAGHTSGSATGATPSASAVPMTASKPVQAIIFALQTFAIGCSVGFMVQTDAHQSRFMFGRAALAATLAFGIQAVTTHGLPSLATLKTMYKAMRGTAAASDLQGISRVALDLNTHNLFYCTLLISAAPSLLLLIPVILHSLLSMVNVARTLLPSVPSLYGMVRPLLDKAAARQQDMLRMSAQIEVGIFFVMIFELFTPRRNLILLALYGQLLRVRYLIQNESKVAWTVLAQRTDSVFLHARSPAFVQSWYRKVRGWVAGLGNPERA